MKFPFLKLDGAGNDFVVIDARQLPPMEDHVEETLARVLCHRHHGIGADGLLMLLAPTRDGFDYRMRYRNADGSVGGMCGNGARSLVRAAEFLGHRAATVRFETDAGDYTGVLTPDVVTIGFPDITELPLPIHIAAINRAADFILVGVPHTVILSEDVSREDLPVIGPLVRRAPEVGSAGTNANFYSVSGPGTLRLRTYERGVEAETLACGTGSIATAYCHARRQNLTGSVSITVIPTGGIPLTAAFEVMESGARKVTLSGPAIVRFSGIALFDGEKIIAS